MSLEQVPNLRKASIVSIVGAVAILVIGSILPKLWAGVLVIAFLSIPFVLWQYIWPRTNRRAAKEDIVVVQSEEAMLRLKLARGEITMDEFNKELAMIQQTPAE